MGGALLGGRVARAPPALFVGPSELPWATNQRGEQMGTGTQPPHLRLGLAEVHEQLRRGCCERIFIV